MYNVLHFSCNPLLCNLMSDIGRVGRILAITCVHECEILLLLCTVSVCMWRAKCAMCQYLTNIRPQHSTFQRRILASFSQKKAFYHSAKEYNVYSFLTQSSAMYFDVRHWKGGRILAITCVHECEILLLWVCVCDVQKCATCKYLTTHPTTTFHISKKNTNKFCLESRQEPQSLSNRVKYSFLIIILRYVLWCQTLEG